MPKAGLAASIFTAMCNHASLLLNYTYHMHSPDNITISQRNPPAHQCHSLRAILNCAFLGNPVAVIWSALRNGTWQVVPNPDGLVNSSSLLLAINDTSNMYKCTVYINGTTADSDPFELPPIEGQL